MKKLLFLSNIEVPYRVRFFNGLAEHCDLTVLYERETSANRNDEWAKRENKKYRVKYLKGLKIADENSFSLGILKEVFSDYDNVIVGCFNSPAQAMAMLIMRMLRKPYILNLDGEPFIDDNNLKTRMKKFILKGAQKYLVAGEKTAETLKTFLDGEAVVPYYFSSLTEQEIREHTMIASKCLRDKTVLVVGQNYDYKGMDVALEAARMDPSIHYKFVGMGKRTAKFIEEHPIPDNVEIIPFLQKEELEKEYQICGMLVLPSRQECWGLVINEAASYGMPIVSTWGSGAAVEFLADSYPQFLAKPNDATDLYNCISCLMKMENIAEYSQFLANRSRKYSVERSLKIYVTTCLNAKDVAEWCQS